LDKVSSWGFKRPRLLAIGQGARATGYARVFSNVLARLALDVDVTHFALNYDGPPIHRGYSVLPNLLPGDVFGRKQLPGLLERLRPDVVLLCHDLPFYSVHKPVLDAYQDRHPRSVVVVYCPVEWASTVAGVFRTLAEADWLVFYTEFGRDVFRSAMILFGIEPRCRTAVVPHGVDTSRFRPLIADDRDESARAARTQLFPGREDLRDAFIVLNANRNSKRKRMDLTLEIFAEFAKARRDAYLYLHMGMLDCGCDVLAIAARLGIRDRLLLTTEDERKPEIDDERLNLIYNACDVGINTSTGEGWGLVAFEHAAAGAPQLMPAHSACQELWTGCGVLMPVHGGDEMLLDVAKAAAELEKLAADPEHRRSLSARHLEFARNPNFSWDFAAERWAALLCEALSRTMDAA
jgi:glycosyltransferase involved in cell wall biosynthesis